MKIRIEEGLPFVTVSLAFRGQNLEIENVLLDTGSLGTVFSADKVLEIGLQYESADMVHRIRGVGGSEFVFTKKVERLSLEDLQVGGFEVEIGAMDYGFPIDGIVGMDFLTQVGAVINLNRLEIYRNSTTLMPTCNQHHIQKEWRPTTFEYSKQDITVHIPNVYAWVCPKDGETSFTPETVDELITIVHELIETAKRAKERRSLLTKYIVSVG